MASQLDGKVVIVTGGSSGIGKAAAVLFARNGAKVVVADINEEGGKKTLDEITEAGGKAIFVKTDVSSAEQAKRCVDEALRNYGRLDGLFSNAGFNPVGTVVDTTEELWENVMGVNLKGSFLMCKYSIPAMKKTGGGSVVVTASVDGVLAVPNEAAYIATKGGLIALVKAMAVDHAKDNVRVNCILPGAIRTPLYEGFAKDSGLASGEGDFQAEQHAMGRIGEPEEVAPVVMFLLSDTPTFLTGAIIPVDGGYSAMKST